MIAPAIALNRFGIFVRSDAPPPSEPLRWLLSQFEKYEAVPSPWQSVTHTPALVEVARAAARGQLGSAAPQPNIEVFCPVAIDDRSHEELFVLLSQRCSKVAHFVLLRTYYLEENQLIKHILGAAIAALATSGHATLLTFEGATTGANRELGLSTADSFGPSLMNYGGYDWLGIAKPGVSVGRPQQITGFEEDEGRLVPLTTPVDAGFHRSAVSGDTVAFTKHFGGATSLMAGIKATAGAGNFDFNSVYLTAAWRDNIGVQVTGYRDGVSVYDLQFLVDHDSPTLFNLGFLNIDEIRFTTSGGDFLYANGSRIGDFSNPSGAFSTPILAFDNMDISAAALAVPEPGSLALLGMGLLGLVASRRRSAR